MNDDHDPSAAGAPRLLVIACLDVPYLPPHFARAGAGEVLILRTPGNIVPMFGAGLGTESATIEYAVDELGLRDVVVLGHTGCGVMRRLVQPHAARPSSMDAFLRHAAAVTRSLGTRAARLGPEALADEAARANVVVQLEHVRAHPSVLVRQRTPDAVQVHGWMLVSRSGELLEYLPREDRFAARREGRERR